MTLKDKALLFCQLADDNNWCGMTGVKYVGHDDYRVLYDSDQHVDGDTSSLIWYGVSNKITDWTNG